MPDKLVGETQASQSLNSVLSHDDRVVKTPAAGKPGGAQAFYFRIKREGPRSCDVFPEVVFFCVKRRHLGSDRPFGVLYDIRDRKRSPREERERALLLAVNYCHRKRRRKGVHSKRRILFRFFRGRRSIERLGEEGGASVRSRDLRPLERYPHRPEPQHGKRCKEMLGRTSP